MTFYEIICEWVKLMCFWLRTEWWQWRGSMETSRSRRRSGRRSSREQRPAPAVLCWTVSVSATVGRVKFIYSLSHKHSQLLLCCSRFQPAQPSYNTPKTQWKKYWGLGGGGSPCCLQVGLYIPKKTGFISLLIIRNTRTRKECNGES